MNDLNYMIWAFVIGVGLAAVYTFYIKKVQGKLVRRLISIDACSPDTAISLDKIDYKMNSIVQSELRRKGPFAETVKVTESGMFYINPEMLDKAKTKYKSDIMPVFILLFLLIMLAGIGLLATYVLPQLIDKFSNISFNL
jgi:hypothetical protein